MMKGIFAQSHTKKKKKCLHCLWPIFRILFRTTLPMHLISPSGLDKFIQPFDKCQSGGRGVSGEKIFYKKEYTCNREGGPSAWQQIVNLFKRNTLIQFTVVLDPEPKGHLAQKILGV